MIPTLLSSESPAALSSAAPSGPVSVIDDLPGAQWDRYVEQHPDATIDHLSGWRHVFERVFHQRSAYLAAMRGGEVAGVLPLVLFRSLIFGRFAVSVPYLNYGGLLASDATAAAALVDRATTLAREFGASHVEFRHQRRQLPGAACREHKVRMVLDLPASSDDLWSGLDRKVRNQVRKAQKEGLTAVSGGAEHLASFYKVFSRNMRDLGTPVYPIDLFAEVLRTFDAGARIHLVHHRGEPVAAALTIRSGPTEVVPWASALREHRSLCPNMLLYWSMLERATAGGVRTFDFGRSSLNAGTHAFKLQWRARAIPLVWEYALLSASTAPEQGPANPRFAFAINAWTRLPLWVANRIGPHLVSNIP